MIERLKIYLDLRKKEDRLLEALDKIKKQRVELEDKITNEAINTGVDKITIDDQSITIKNKSSYVISDSKSYNQGKNIMLQTIKETGYDKDNIITSFENWHVDGRKANKLLESLPEELLARFKKDGSILQVIKPMISIRTKKL